MTGKGPPRRGREGRAQVLELAAKRALLADIITGNRSAFKPGLNPDMDQADRDHLVKYIESLEEWQANLGRAGPPPTAGELGWRAGVLEDEIQSWKFIMRDKPSMPPDERADLLQTVRELQRWRAELMAQKRAMM
jgi:hypothetical protein